MALRIELGPNERIIVGDAAIRNGPRRTRLIIETKAKILRERDVIFESEADTPCKRLYLTLEEGYLAADSAEAEARFTVQANEIMQAVPSMAPFIARIYLHMTGEDVDLYKALKEAKSLIAYEAELLTIAAEHDRAVAAAGDQAVA